jgi:YggT family protein
MGAGEIGDRAGSGNPACAIAAPHPIVYRCRHAGREAMLIVLLQILTLLLSVAMWIIIAQAVLSWLVAFNIINTQSDFVRSVLYALDRMTEPLYRPIRRIMPDFGALDLSPMVVLLIIIILRDYVIPAIWRSQLAG